MKRISKKFQNTLKAFVGVATLITYTACGSATDASLATLSETETESTYFPTSLAVASPLDTADDSEVQALTQYLSSATSVKKYAWATRRIEQILDGSTPVHCTFDPELFLTVSEDAGCFGPLVEYENHADEGTGSNGVLPTGDVGLWTEEDAATGTPCTAAELTARMDSISDKSLASLMGLASMVCTIKTNSLSMPDATTPSVDLISYMSATDTTFTAATINYDSTTGAYSYALDFTYASSSQSYLMSVDMEHTPDTGGAYEGQVSYLVNDTFIGGNCPTTDVTYNGSLQYDRDGLEQMATQVREGLFCNPDPTTLVDGRTAGLVDPSDKYSSSNPAGWGNDMSIFTANYNPVDLNGSYSYSWQAGPQDSDSRIFNLVVDNTVDEDGNATDDQTGKAFFGYGEDIEFTNGAIEGFICNWAGPNADHNLIDQVQYQEVDYDATSGTLTSVAANIEYAPVNDCEYDADIDDDGVVDGDFIYDTNGDGDMSDESVQDIANELDILEDSDASGEFDIFEDAGFTLPTI